MQGNMPQMYLQPCEELVGILVLADIGGLPIVVLEGHPEASGQEEWPVTQCQVAKHLLHWTLHQPQ